MALLIFIFGLAVGSFLNVVIARLHSHESFLKGRSHCPHCRGQLAWHDNIPLLSFALLGGKCRRCQKRISWQYPAVELATGVLFVLTYVHNLPMAGEYFILNIRDWFFIAVLLVIFVYDLRWYLILDSITIPAIIIAFIGNLFLSASWRVDFLNLALAVVIGGGFFLLQFLVSRGKWIGGGDIRLGALMGALLGFPQVLVVLAFAYFSGAIVGIGLVAAGRKQFSARVPFGTFLSAGTIIALLYGEVILRWYLGIIGY